MYALGEQTKIWPETQMFINVSTPEATGDNFDRTRRIKSGYNLAHARKGWEMGPQLREWRILLIFWLFPPKRWFFWKKTSKFGKRYFRVEGTTSFLFFWLRRSQGVILAQLDEFSRVLIRHMPEKSEEEAPKTQTKNPQISSEKYIFFQKKVAKSRKPSRPVLGTLSSLFFGHVPDNTAIDFKSSSCVKIDHYYLRSRKIKREADSLPHCT